MKTKLNILASLCVICLGGGLASAAFNANSSDSTGAAKKSRENTQVVDEPHMDDQIRSLLSGEGGDKWGLTRSVELIKGAPYSAEVISETILKLTDGNVISNKTTSLSFRDSLGRIREELRDQNGVRVKVNINENVDERIILNLKTKTATRMVTRFTNAGLINGKNAEQMFKDLNVRSKPERPQSFELENIGIGSKNGEHFTIVQLPEKRSGDAQKSAVSKGKSVMVDVRGSANNMIESSFSRLLADAKWSNKRQTKLLGNRDFDGVKAEGKLVSFEIPAGAVGNAKTILVTDETWTSPELQITVFSKYSDPRSGERIYRLNNIKRGEVPASMFTIPADYTIRDIGRGL